MKGSNSSVQSGKPLRALLFSVILLLLTGCKEEILHGLSEWEANRILTRLHFVQIKAEKVAEPDGRWAVAVPPQDAIVAMQQLEATRVLRGRDATQEATPNFLSSRELNRFHHERLLSREIEQSVLAMPGILDVRVHINLPEHDSLLLKPQKGIGGAASALLIAAPDAVLQEAQIASLISGASGIAADSVHVVVQRDHEAGRMPSGTQLAALEARKSSLLGGDPNTIYVGLGAAFVVLGLGAVVWSRKRVKSPV